MREAGGERGEAKDTLGSVFLHALSIQQEPLEHLARDAQDDRTRIASFPQQRLTRRRDSLRSRLGDGRHGPRRFLRLLLPPKYFASTVVVRVLFFFLKRSYAHARGLVRYNSFTTAAVVPMFLRAKQRRHL